MTRQQYRVLQYMDDFGSITPMEAFTELGITKLATRISEIRRMNLPIEIRKERETAKNRYGESVCYMRYYLE